MSPIATLVGKVRDLQIYCFDRHALVRFLSVGGLLVARLFVSPPMFAAQTMSVRLRIDSAETRRPPFQTRSRCLVHSSEPPDPSATRKTVCEAIETDGRPCDIALAEDEDWCSRHAQDLEDLNMAWEKIQKEVEEIDVTDPTTAKRKTEKLHLAVSLRRRLRERFHTRGVDAVDFMRWFAKVEQDTSLLADSVMSESCRSASWSEASA